MLRKELQVLKRHVKKPQFTSSDRLLFVSFLRHQQCVIQRMVTIKPATVLQWHRQLQRRKWKFSQQRSGRPPVDEKIQKLVIEMKRNNPRWRARRIKGELRKIDITLSKSSICTLLNGSYFPPSAPKFDETWIPFLNIPAIYHCELAWQVSPGLLQDSPLPDTTTQPELQRFHRALEPYNPRRTSRSQNLFWTACGRNRLKCQSFRHNVQRPYPSSGSSL